jgi:hypothetical protein
VAEPRRRKTYILRGHQPCAGEQKGGEGKWGKGEIETVHALVLIVFLNSYTSSGFLPL